MVHGHGSGEAILAWQVRPYAEDVVQLVVGSDHPLAGRAEIDKGELAGLRFVAMHRSSTVQGIKSTLEAAGIQWKTLQVVMARALLRPPRFHLSSLALPTPKLRTAMGGLLIERRLRSSSPVGCGQSCTACAAHIQV